MSLIDAIVVGGGPAGLYAGLQLVQAGFSVALFEEHQSVGAPVHCTGVARGRVCVLACGASYALQRKLGLGMPRLLLHSAQIELPAARLGDVEVHFGRSVAPQGFAWAVPVQRERPYVRIGVMCERGAGRHFGDIVARLSARWGISPSDVRQPRQKILPLGPIERTYGDRVLALGDA